jgi:hypothetical protein
MKKSFTLRLILFVTILLASVNFLPATIYPPLPDTTYYFNCVQPVWDIQSFTVKDMNGDGRYEQMMTVWCDVLNNQLDTIVSPIIITHPDLILGLPINDIVTEPLPWEKKERPQPTPKKKPKFTADFVTDEVSKTLVYSYTMYENDMNVYYDQFTQLINSVKDPVNENGIHITPNPASSKATMSFAMSTADNVKIVLFDINGIEIATLANENMDNGIQDIPIETASLPNGMYIIRTTIGTNTLVNTLTVIK